MFAYLAMLALSVVHGMRAVPSRYLGLALLQAPSVLFVGLWRDLTRGEKAEEWVLVLGPALFVYLLATAFVADREPSARRSVLRKRALLTTLFAVMSAVAHPELLRKVPVLLALIAVIGAVGVLPLAVRSEADNGVTIRRSSSWARWSLRLAILRAAARVVVVLDITFIGALAVSHGARFSTTAVFALSGTVAWLLAAFLVSEGVKADQGAQPWSRATLAVVIGLISLGFAGALGVFFGSELEQDVNPVFWGGLVLAVLGWRLPSRPHLSCP